jgi:hypothetical protein
MDSPKGNYNNLYIARPRKYLEIYNSLTIYAVLPTGKVHPSLDVYVFGIDMWTVSLKASVSMDGY